MPARNTIEIVINAQDNASRVLQNTVRGIQDVGQTALNVATGALAVAGTATAGFAAAGVAEFQSFERGMNEVFTLLPNITEEAMAQMEDDVLAFSSQFASLPEETVPALYQALSAGVPQDNVFEFLETAQKAAVGGVTDLNTAVDGISSVVNAYGEDVIDATQASDLMFTAVRLGKTTFEELSSQLFQVTPMAASLGLEFENVTAALATMTSQGFPTAQATTRINAALQELADSTTDAGELFTEVAGTSFRQFIDQGGNLHEALQLLEQGADQAGIPFDELFGSIEAGQAVIALTGSNAESFASNLEEMGAAGGATQAAFDEMQRGIGAALDEMRASFKVLLIEIGSLIAPALVPVIRGFTTLIRYISDVLSTGDALNDWLADVPRPIRGLVRALGNVVAGFRMFFTSIDEAQQALDNGMPALEVFYRMIQRIMVTMGASASEALSFTTHLNNVIQIVSNGLRPIINFARQFFTLSDVINALGIAVGLVVVPAIFSLVTGIVSALTPITALISAIALLRNAWESDFAGIRTVFTEVWVNTLQPAFERFGNWVNGFFGGSGSSGFSNVLSSFEELASVSIQTVVPAIGEIIAFFLDNIPVAFETVQNLWQNVLKPAFEAITTFIQDNLMPILREFSAWFTESALPTVINYVQNTALPAIQTFFNWIGDAWENVLAPTLNQLRAWFTESALPSIISYIQDTALPAIQGLFNFLGNVWTTISVPLNSMRAWFVEDGMPAIVAFLNNNVKPIVQWIVDKFQWIMSEAGNVGRAAQEALTGNVGALANQAGEINNIASDVGWLEVARQVGRSTIAEIRGNAFGGRVRAGEPTWVGEHGSEIFVPQSDGRIMNNRESTLATQSNAPTVNMTFNFSGNMSREDARESATTLVSELRRFGVNLQG